VNGASDSTAIATTATASSSRAGRGAGYVGRFAPSPTGALHLGSLVAALGSYLDARRNSGRWLLRIEDLDTPRVRPGCADQMLRTLEQLGLLWDGEVQYQSRRRALFEEAVAQLERLGLTYHCVCTRRMRGELEVSAYPGTCRQRQRAPGGAAALRFRIDDAASISFDDRLQGRCQFALRDLGDVIIRRRDGIFAYQLAVVVDDGAQQITDVVRGSDLLESTAWQLQMQQALNIPMPRYAHLPLVVEPSGEKLSKSARALSLRPGQAGAELIRALNLLRQTPPADLVCERPETILRWAIEHWMPANLERVQKAAAPVKQS
jgi:glutamyl-Q tRNA(Asp) synthetase